MMGKDQLEIYLYNGPEYVPERDNDRLRTQTDRIFHLMQDGRWRTVTEIALITNDPEPSISAQLRHLRKPKHGSHTVNRRCRKGHLFEYQVIPNDKKNAPE